MMLTGRRIIPGPGRSLLQHKQVRGWRGRAAREEAKAFAGCALRPPDDYDDHDHEA